MTVTADTGTQRREVVVIGGGQAGLAVGYYLAQQNRRFTILEAAGEPASAWRSRWDSLRLFTSVRYDSLPGLDFPGDPDSYPGRDEVIAYLTDYARRFELPVEFNSRVQAVRARDDGGFLVELADRTYEADQVVVATGPFQVPFTPADSRRPQPRGGAAAQHPVPLPGRPPDRHGAGGGRRQHRLPDQRGARALAAGPSGHRRPSDAAAAAHPRQGPVPLPAGHGPDVQDRGFAPRAAPEGQGDAHRLQPARRAQARHPAAAARDRGSGPQRHVRRRLRARRRRRGVGDRVPARPLLRAAPGLRRDSEP